MAKSKKKFKTADELAESLKNSNIETKDITKEDFERNLEKMVGKGGSKDSETEED